MLHNEYRKSLALGGTDIRGMVTDYEAWLFERKLKEAGGLPPWLQKDPSPAAAFGTAVHLALLEPEQYDKFAVIMDYCENFALKAGREIKEKAQALCVTPEHFTMRQEQAWAIKQIRGNFFFAVTEAQLPLPQLGDVELERWAVRGGIECKGKLDWLTRGTVIDLKTVSDIHRIQSIKYENAYHAQLAHYAAFDNHDKTAIVWIESAAPYRVVVEYLSNDDKDFGKQAMNIALDKYRKHKGL
jgi:hypothetical protein